MLWLLLWLVCLPTGDMNVVAMAPEEEEEAEVGDESKPGWVRASWSWSSVVSSIDDVDEDEVALAGMR